MGAAESHIHVANATNKTVYVLVIPNSRWLLADVGTAFALSLVTGGGSSAQAFTAVKTLKDVLDNLKSLYAVVKGAMLLKDLASFGEAASMTRQQQKADCYATIKNLMEKGVCIDAQQVADVCATSLCNPLTYMSPSAAKNLTLDVKDSELIIWVDDPANPGQMSRFTTNCDESWIAKPARIVRAKYGKLWQEDAAAGQASWGQGA